MDDRHDPSLVRFAASLVQCQRRAPQLVAATSPIGWPHLAPRFALEADLAEARGAVHAAAVKRDWLAFLGYEQPSAVAALLDQLATDGDEAGEAGEARRRAIAARSEASAEIDRAIDVLVDRTHRRTVGALRARAEAWCILAAAAPIRVTDATAARAARRVGRRVPPLPAVERYAHRPPNLLTEVVASALPTLLASAPARLLVANLPRPISVAVRSGRLATTVTLDRSVIRVRNGVGRHVAILFHGEIDSLLRHAAVQVEREVAGLEAR